jgi:hypothetical protein
MCRALWNSNRVCRIFCHVSEFKSVSRCRVLGSLSFYSLYKIKHIWSFLNSAESPLIQSFECSSIVSGHAFQNACHLNTPLFHLVMLLKMPAIWMHLYFALRHSGWSQTTVIGPRDLSGNGRKVPLLSNHWSQLESTLTGQNSCLRVFSVLEADFRETQRL